MTFTYQKKDESDDTDATFSLTVPLLAVVPIPYIRIDEMTIDFKAKLTDSIKRSTDQSLQVNVNTGGSYSSFWSPVKLDFRVNATAKTASSQTSSQTREYTMDIHVRAVQDQMPAGLSKMLDILESAIRDKKSSTPA